MTEWSSLRLCDVANLLLGTVLFFSPWLFDLANGAPWQTALVVGIIIAVLSIAALAAFAVWEEWLNLVAGLALIAAPWLLEFQDSPAVTIDVAVGIAVASLAAFEAGWHAIRSRGSKPKNEWAGNVDDHAARVSAARGQCNALWIRINSTEVSRR